MAYTLLLHGQHAASVVPYQPLGSWIVPWRFEGFETEYRALTSGTGLIDYSTQALIEVRGANRMDFLHRILTNDINRLTPGTGCRAALLTVSAKLIAEFLVLVDADAVWLLCDLEQVDAAVKTLIWYVFNEDVMCRSRERAMAVLAVQGPRTMDMLPRLFGPSLSLLRPGDHLMTKLGGTAVRVVRHTLTGGTGALCLVPADEVKAVWTRLQELGAPELRLVGWEALNAARIEAGIPWFGLDMDESNLLSETGLEASTVSDTKGCYLGQEIIARLATYGSVAKKLVGLLIDGADVPPSNSPILYEGGKAGRLTSACVSPALGRPIGMGYVRSGAYEPGTRVEILWGDRRVPSMVASRPLVATG